MIVERFLEWLPTAGAAKRAAAAGAISRAFLTSDLSAEEREGIEAALTLLLDDPSPDVRHALAEALCRSEKAPNHIILTLTRDKPAIAALVAAHSPLVLDSELVDLVGSGEEVLQVAVARRPYVSRAVSAALSEVAGSSACLELLCNGGARVPRFSVDRIVERHGSDPEIRDVLLKRDDLPVEIRHALVSQFALRLGSFVGERRWLEGERAEGVAADARDKATIAMAFEAPAEDLPALVRRLVSAEQLTPAFLIRVAAAGQAALFAAALAELGRVPLERVRALMAGGRISSVRALLRKAGLPRRTFPAFVTAVEVMRREEGGGSSGDYRRATRLIEAVLANYGQGHDTQMDDILALLRRFAADAKRDAARSRAERAKRAA